MEPSPVSQRYTRGFPRVQGHGQVATDAPRGTGGGPPARRSAITTSISRPRDGTTSRCDIKLTKVEIYVHATSHDLAAAGDPPGGMTSGDARAPRIIDAMANGRHCFPALRLAPLAGTTEPDHVGSLEAMRPAFNQDNSEWSRRVWARRFAVRTMRVTSPWRNGR
jgi:hypothetical protein